MTTQTPLKHLHRFLIWPTEALKVAMHDRIPALRRFNAWANEKERAYHRRRNASLVIALREAGLGESADRLDAVTQ